MARVSIPEPLTFDASGVLTVVVQDAASGDVLMVAHASAEALRLTAETGLAHFWSRRRRELWRKGGTSGNALRVRELRADCDGDALLMLVEPLGPACHAGTRTCFGERSPTALGVLEELRQVIAARRTAAPQGSYTAHLFAAGQDAILKKVVEEATEVVIAAKAESASRLAEESADLLFHLLVALEERGVGLDRVLGVLRQRRG